MLRQRRNPYAKKITPDYKCKQVPPASFQRRPTVAEIPRPVGIKPKPFGCSSVLHQVGVSAEKWAGRLPSRFPSQIVVQDVTASDAAWWNLPTQAETIDIGDVEGRVRVIEVLGILSHATKLYEIDVWTRIRRFASSIGVARFRTPKTRVDI